MSKLSADRSRREHQSSNSGIQIQEDFSVESDLGSGLIMPKSLAEMEGTV